MKVFVTYDEQGTITGIGMPAPDFCGSTGMASQPGSSVCVFEVDEIKHPHHFQKALHELRVDVKSGQPKLIKRRLQRSRRSR